MNAKNPVCQILVQCLPFKIYEGMCRQTQAHLTKTSPLQLPEKVSPILSCCKLVKRIFVIFGDIWKCVVLFKRIYIYHLWWHLKICCLRCLLGGWVLPTNRKVKLKNKHRVALFAHARLSAITKIQTQIQKYKNTKTNTKSFSIVVCFHKWGWMWT